MPNEEPSGFDSPRLHQFGVLYSKFHQFSQQARFFAISNCFYLCKVVA
jgi:hypothetical protein